MNYMEKVAQMLGVELDEEFNLIGVDLPYKISKDGMKIYDGINDEWRYSSSLLPDILLGKYKIKKSILTKQEKEYLSYVIKPFRKEVRSIMKVKYCKEAYIQITFHDYCDMSFPYFEDGTMYKGMEADKEYSLEDLRL